MTYDPLKREFYGHHRAKQLRYLAFSGLAAGLVLAVMAAIGFAYDDSSVGIYVGVPALTLTGFSIGSVVHLRHRRYLAKVLCIMTSVLLIVMGLVLARSPFGLLLIVIGVWMLVQSVRRDDDLVP
jgi:uncharacterized membrane protein